MRVTNCGPLGSDEEQPPDLPAPLWFELAEGERTISQETVF
jgi:hypothetical protein